MEDKYGIILLVLVVAIAYGIILVIKDINSSMAKDASDSPGFIDVKINKAIKRSQLAISKTYLTGCSWILVNEEYSNVLYTFKNTNELLITTNGIVERCEYEFIVDSDTILITQCFSPLKSRT